MTPALARLIALADAGEWAAARALLMSDFGLTEDVLADLVLDASKIPKSGFIDLTATLVGGMLLGAAYVNAEAPARGPTPAVEAKPA